MTTRKKFSSEEEVDRFLDNLTYANMRNWLKSFLMEEIPEKVVITQEQFNAFFKIRGVQPDGTDERRGRPKK